MPKYVVRLERTIWQETEIEVEADSRADAEERAIARTDKDPAWERRWDYQETSDIVVTRVTDAQGNDVDDPEW